MNADERGLSKKFLSALICVNGQLDLIFPRLLAAAALITTPLAAQTAYDGGSHTAIRQALAPATV